ncbi:MAG: ABC transporter permease [Endomicrobiales bacterium]|nr:ABC transporter permease [Endomicrobiales bacterium]
MNDKYIFSISAKNLKRRMRRSVLNITSIAITSGIFLFFIGFYRGTYIAMMRESFIQLKSAHVQMHSPAFDDKKIQDYVAKESVIKDYPPIVQKILKMKNVTGVSPRLISAGFIGNGREKLPVMVTGCDPELERNFGFINEALKEGAYLDASGGVLLGRKAADLFGFKVGDLCYVQAQTVHNTPNLLILPVTGIYETKFHELDKNTVFIRIDDANLLCDTGDSVNKIFVMLERMNDTGAAVSALEKEFGDRFDVKPWEYYAQALLEGEKGDGIFYAIFLTILLFISVTTIMGTMYVNVYERIREMATLRAIGWQRQEIFKLVVYESLAIGVIGSLIGLILGGIPTAYMTYIGFDYSKMTEMVSLPILRLISRPALYDPFLAVSVGIVSTFFGGLLPAIKASKMIITDALRVN